MIIGPVVGPWLLGPCYWPLSGVAYGMESENGMRCDKNVGPSRLRSGTSFGFVGAGLCGIGRKPSLAASRPVRIAITPGASIAAAVSILLMLACA